MKEGIHEFLLVFIHHRHSHPSSTRNKTTNFHRSRISLEGVRGNLCPAINRFFARPRPPRLNRGCAGIRWVAPLIVVGKTLAATVIKLQAPHCSFLAAFNCRVRRHEPVFYLEGNTESKQFWFIRPQRLGASFAGSSSTVNKFFRRVSALRGTIGMPPVVLVVARSRSVWWFDSTAPNCGGRLLIGEVREGKHHVLHQGTPFVVRVLL